MEILNASDAKREFGEVLLKAQKEPIGINRHRLAVYCRRLELPLLHRFESGLVEVHLQS